MPASSQQLALRDWRSYGVCFSLRLMRTWKTKPPQIRPAWFMTDPNASYRRILKSSFILGGASALNIALGLIRTKVVAVMLGPAGIGLVSLYTSLMQSASICAAMGMGAVGPRQIAQAADQGVERAITVARRSMFYGALLLAGLGALAVWSLRDIVSQYLLGSTERALEIGWLALGVALSVAGTAQGAVLQGMCRVADVARLTVWGSALNTVAGVFVLWFWGTGGVVAYVLAGPLASFLAGHWYVSRSPKQTPTGVRLGRGGGRMA